MPSGSSGSSIQPEGDMTDERELLRRTADLAADYLDTLDTRPIRPEVDYQAMLAAVDAPVPEHGTNPLAVIEELASVAEPGLTAMGSGRFFGFVIGGALPAALAADVLASAWDQNNGLAAPTPAGLAPAGDKNTALPAPPPATAALETVAGRWVLDLLGLPTHCSFAF